VRIGWATPFNVRSAIAKYSRDLCVELSLRGAKIEILRTETGEGAKFDVLPTKLALHSADHFDDATLRRRFDLCVVNIGDHFPFHYHALDLMLQRPSVAIFHDASVVNLINGLRNVGYPVDQWNVRFGTGAAEGPERPEIDFRPLRFLASLALAAVGHGPHYIRALEDSCPGPVAELPLCQASDEPIECARAHADRFLIVTFGVINLNKQASRVIRAIASSDRLGKRALYRLVGQIAPKHKVLLANLASKLGVDCEFYNGWIPDHELACHLTDADAICCLRFPVLEGGSASLIRGLYAGRPLIIPDFGSYSRVPSELAWKVSCDDDPRPVRTALEQIAADRPAADARAVAALQWAKRTYSLAAYVDALLPFLRRALDTAPYAEAGRTIGNTLVEMGVEWRDPISLRLAKAGSDLFDEAD